MPPAFLELSMVLVLATVLGIVARSLKQPLILAYIFSGIIISSVGYFRDFDLNFFETLSNLGIAFLLFLVGIDLKLTDLKYVGKAALLTGLGQIVFTSIIGFIILSALGFSVVPAIYISVALTFSSTVIIIKLLSEKNALQSLYGRIAVGFLLVQDFVAVLALIVLSGFGNEASAGPMAMIMVIIKGVLLIGGAYFASKTLLKRVFNLVSSSTELLFVSAITWAFLFSVAAGLMGFSIAIGAFLAGLSIASSPHSSQISARIKPLRDFFIIIFFIFLGTSMNIGSSGVSLTNVILLSIFILIGNPLIVIAIMMTLGYRNRTSFLASVTVAQISEFSLILMAVGQSLGHVSDQMVSLVAAVGIVTITFSSYLILYGDKIYKFLAVPLAKIVPEKARDPYVSNRDSLAGHTVLIGAEQMGWDVLKFLDQKYENKEDILIVDYNPEIIRTLKAGGYNAVYGDISDFELLEELELGKAKLVVITNVDINDCTGFIKFAKSRNYMGPIIAATYWIHDAVRLYELGADYVVVPEDVGGKHIAHILSHSWTNLSSLKKSRSKNFEDLVSHKVF